MRKGLKAGMLLLLLADLVYVFIQYYHGGFDGDLAGVVLPSATYSKVLTSPFGLDVLLHNAHYAGTNRFALHWAISKYFKTVPFLFQYISNPLDSVYLACALIKTLIHVSLIYLLSVYISGQYKIYNKNFLLAALLMSPLFQTYGFTWQMGVIDPCIIYAFTYPYSIMWVIIFFLPFFMKLFHHRPLTLDYRLIPLLLALIWIISFNGAIGAPMLMIIYAFMLLELWRTGMKQNRLLPFTQRASISYKQIPKNFLLLFIIAVLVTIYSFYIGRNNSENFAYTIPLYQRYLRLPQGVFEMFTTEGLGMLLVMILINIAIIFRMRNDPRAQKILRLFFWIGLFSLTFILLLPLGGYRIYRPNIVRRDTLLPVILALIGFYAMSTLYLLKYIAPHYKKIYLGIVIIPLLRYVIVNTYNQVDNSCEKNAIKQIAASKEKIVALDQQCYILSWEKITDYRDSKVNTDLLRYWGIIHEEKYYYQK